MEDLWGSPWASDLPAHHSRLDDFPAAPATAHFGGAPQQQQHALPRKISQNLSPWHDDNAWGDVQGPQRWRGAGAGASPRSKAADAHVHGPTGLRREVSPDPWKALDSGHFETRARAAQETETETLTAFVPSGGSSSEARHGQASAEEKKARETTEDEVPTEDPAAAMEMQDHVWAAERDASRASAEPDLTKSSSEGEESSIEGPGGDEPRGPGAEPHVDIRDELTDSEHSEDAEPGPKAFEAKAEPAILEKDVFPAAKPSMLFPIDFAALDRVFPTTGPVNTRPEPIPDVIIDNTFTTISERKTWYRISRYGSTRKHDSGMDDGYIRAKWAGSEVRSRTLKTVQRWMEQDALTGRPHHLGGRPGASGASLFNWDSKAPPVEIGQLLEKHGRQTKHARHTSLVPAATAPPEDLGWADASPSSHAAEKPKQRPVSMIQLASAPVPNPWADSPTALKFAPLPSPMKTSPARPSNLKNVETADSEPAQQNGPENNNTNDSNSNSNSNHGEDEEEGDDDEWGEMVGTTPAGDTGNIFGPLSETARASLESFKGDVFDGESPPDKAPQPPNITDLPTSASTIWDVSHPEDGVSPSPSASAGGRAAAAAAAPTAFPFPPAYITPPITPAPSTPTTRPALALHEGTGTGTGTGISIDNANRKASLAQAIAMSSPATSVSDRDADLERARERRREKDLENENEKKSDKDDDMDAVVAEILRNLPDLTYMLR